MAAVHPSPHRGRGGGGEGGAPLDPSPGLRPPSPARGEGTTLNTYRPKRSGLHAAGAAVRRLKPPQNLPSSGPLHGKAHPGRGGASFRPRRIPNPDFRPSAAACRFGSSLAPRPAPLTPAVGLPPSASSAASALRLLPFSSSRRSGTRSPRRPAKLRWPCLLPVPCSPFPPSPPGHGCPQVSGTPFSAPCSPLLGVIHNGTCPCVHVKTIKFGSKSIKKATFSVKKGSKRRAFRHAHLNILGCHPLWR